ncbi:SDR family oxidoreductase [Zavarzinia sp. CC-PAN008]|uniref:SDR family oxidoreductase n=1 Tax=Zavarzinia sp. CC-PAN008 TaxID=3243332 RepID=UPI003F7433BC
MRSVVVTGVSTGIGWATARVLMGNGFRVFGSVRKPADAERLASEFPERFVPLVFDVTDEAAVKAAAEQVRAALGGETLAGLVNNAGIAVAGPMLMLPVAEFRHQLEVNLTGVMIATQAFGPLLGADLALKGPAGRIVNMSSVGGRNGTPFLAPYNTTKFGLEGLSEALRRELLLFGIDVVIVAPGAVATPIWAKAEAVDVSAYMDTPYGPGLEKVRRFMIDDGPNGLPPERIGETVLKALTARRPRVRYTVAPQPVQTFLFRVLPRRWVDFGMGRALKLLPRIRP